MVKRSRPVIQGTLRGPDAPIEVEGARRPGRGIAATQRRNTLKLTDELIIGSI
jgi:hypothetical protein